ncbi:alpha/beta hydrolase [Streptomyces sp. S1A(2023)]
MSMPHRLIGSGDHKVLVLHDWFGTSSGWGPILDYLDGDTFSYALLDYRGYGDRRAVGGAYTLAEIADDALALAGELGWGSFSLIGHSMGGKAAQQVLAQAPGRVRKLVGLAPVPAGVYPLDRDGEALFYGAAHDRDKRRTIVDLVTGRRAPRAWPRPDGRPLVGVVDPRGVRRLREGLGHRRPHGTDHRQPRSGQGHRRRARSRPDSRRHARHVAQPLSERRTGGDPQQRPLPHVRDSAGPDDQRRDVPARLSRPPEPDRPAGAGPPGGPLRVRAAP